MKHAFLFGFFLFSTTLLFAQQTQLPTENGKVIYQGVVEANGFTQAQLYANAKKWIANTFNSSKDVIQYDDNSSEIIGKGVLPVQWPVKKMLIPSNAAHTFKLKFKDGKYQYSIYDISIYTDSSQSYTVESIIAQGEKQQPAINNIDSAFKSMISSLKSEMINRSENW